MLYSPTSPFLPERMLAQYAGVAELMAPFQDANFDQYADPTWELRDAIRAGNPGWEYHGQDIPALEDELHLLRKMSEFIKSKAKIYSFETHQPRPVPSSALDEISWADMRLPKGCVYLHWGLLRDICLPGRFSAQRYGHAAEQDASDSFLEGAFVRTTSWHALEVLLIFRAEGQPAPGQASASGVARPPVVEFSIDKSAKASSETLLDSSVLIFRDLWDTSDRSGELEIGTIRKLLRSPRPQMGPGEREQYEVYIGSIRHILACLAACFAMWPVQLIDPFHPEVPLESLGPVEPYPDSDLDIGMKG